MFLLDHLPENLCLVIASRSDPPLQLPRLRARGQLLELRQADLRLTAEEAAAFLNQVMGLGLSPEDVTALEARTEGWVAGLQMAALAMRGIAAQGRRPEPGRAGRIVRICPGLYGQPPLHPGLFDGRGPGAATPGHPGIPAHDLYPETVNWPSV